MPDALLHGGAEHRQRAADIILVSQAAGLDTDSPTDSHAAKWRTASDLVQRRRADLAQPRGVAGVALAERRARGRWRRGDARR